MKLGGAKVNFADPANGVASVVAGDVEFTFTDPYAVYLVERESGVLLDECFEAAKKIVALIQKIDQAARPRKAHPETK